MAGAVVEVEPYHPEPPKTLPADEFMNRTARTDPNGLVTTTLTEPGWWAVTATRAAGRHDHRGKAYPVRQRTTFWVAVEERPTDRAR